MPDPKATVHFRSLGCPKNLLDTEVMLGTLASSGFALAEELEDADVAVVNTCSFIESAREESVKAILEVADLRESGRLRALVVTGCLPQRYGADLAKELPEVDAFLGTSAFPEIARVLEDALAGRGRGVYVEAGRTHLYDDASPRLLTGPAHSAYVKIAEGCDRVCAFCAIPGIRGRFQSRRLDSLVAEARALAAAGVREINLVAQDSTSWGKDLPPVPGAGELAGLGQDGAERAALEAAADARDRAERADAVAALRDLEIGRVGRADQEPRRVLVIEMGAARLHVDAAPAAGAAQALWIVAAQALWIIENAVEDPGDAGELPGADEGVDLGQLPGEVGPVALGQAAGHDEPAQPPPAAQLRHLQDGVDRLLAGALDERAGVDHRDVGVLDPLGEGVAGAGQGAQHQLPVEAVLRAAERAEVHGGFGGLAGVGHGGAG